jgi:hypothetical protein
VSHWRKFLFAMCMGFGCAHCLWRHFRGGTSCTPFFGRETEYLDECGGPNTVAIARLGIALCAAISLGRHSSEAYGAISMESPILSRGPVQSFFA